jgi:hypothetical protein
MLKGETYGQTQRQDGEQISVLSFYRKGYMAKNGIPYCAVCSDKNSHSMPNKNQLVNDS